MPPVVISINLASVQHLALIHFLKFINKMCHREISGHMNMEKMSTKENIKEQVKNDLWEACLMAEQVKALAAKS